MNMQLVITGLIEIAISFITCILIFFFSFKVFSMFTKNIDEIEELKKNNIAISILIIAFIFGIMLLVKESVAPAKDTLTNLIKSKTITASIVTSSILRILSIYLIAAVFSFIILWLSLKFFMLLTLKIDEMKEIKNKNSAVAFIMASLIISIVILLKMPLATLLNGIIKPPTVNVTVTEPFFNYDLINKGLIELAISLIAVIFIFLISFKIFSMLTKNIDEMEELKSNNNAIGILMAGFNFSMMLLIKAAINPAIDALEFALGKKAGNIVILQTVGLMVLYFIIAALFAFIILWFAMKFFILLTKSMNEMTEIKNKNIAISLIIAILLISSAIMLQKGLETLLSGMVITPKLGTGILDLSNFK